MQKVDKKTLDRITRSKLYIQQAQHRLNSSLFSHLLTAVPICHTNGESNEPFWAHIDLLQGIIWVNSNGKKVLSSDEWSFILAHLLLHLALNHRQRMEDREPNLWNYACDIVIDNLLPSLGFRVKPPLCHVYSEFSKSSEEDIYELLTYTPKPLANFETLAGIGKPDMVVRAELETPRRCAGYEIATLMKSYSPREYARR